MIAACPAALPALPRPSTAVPVPARAPALRFPPSPSPSVLRFSGQLTDIPHPSLSTATKRCKRPRWERSKECIYFFRRCCPRAHLCAARPAALPALSCPSAPVPVPAPAL
eukprot:2937192-Rhodomonas_salina.1